jgi:hypothetical protein
MLVILIIKIIFFNKKSIESYDARYVDINVDNCAKFCKKTVGCQSFAFDAKNKVCYPSKRELFGISYGSLFEKQYKPTNLVCNKFKAINKPTKNPSFVDRKSNAIFACNETVGLQPQLYFHNKNRLNNIEEGQNPDFITQVDNYHVNCYRWPINKYDTDQLDLLRREKQNRILSNKTVTMMDRVREAKPDIETNNKIDSESGNENNNSSIEKKKFWPIKDEITNRITKLQKVINIPLNKILGYTTEEENNRNLERFENINKFTAFELLNSFNQGAYLRNHKCVKNIPLKSCLLYYDILLGLKSSYSH